MLDLGAVSAEICRLVKIKPRGQTAVENGCQQFCRRTFRFRKGDGLQGMLETQAFFGVGCADAADRAFDALRDDDMRAFEALNKTRPVNHRVWPTFALGIRQHQRLERGRGKVGIFGHRGRGDRLIGLVGLAAFLRRFEALADDPVLGAIHFFAAQLLKLANESV